MSGCVARCITHVWNGFVPSSPTDTPVSRSLHADTHFYKFAINTLGSKSKIPLKVNELEGMIMESKTKRSTEHWQNDFDRLFFFLFKKKMFLFSQTVLVNLIYFFLK